MNELEARDELQYHKEKLQEHYFELEKQLRLKYAIIERENEYLRKLICDARMFEVKPFPLIASDFDNGVLKSLPDHYGIQRIAEKIIP